MNGLYVLAASMPPNQEQTDNQQDFQDPPKISATG